MQKNNKAYKDKFQIKKIRTFKMNQDISKNNKLNSKNLNIPKTNKIYTQKKDIDL